MKTDTSSRAAASFLAWTHVACPRCEQVPVAPCRSIYVGERDICHCWSCEACGHQYATTVTITRPVRADARAAA